MHLQKVDLNSPAFKLNPFPTFATLRERGPLVYVKLPFVGKTWVTTTYEATTHVLRHKEDFVTQPGNAGRRRMAGGMILRLMPKSLKAMMQSMIVKDEPDHRRLRKLVDAAFQRQSIDELRPRIHSIVEDHLNQLDAQSRKTGRVDLIPHLARPFPLAVICELLGLPHDDRAEFMKIANLGNMKPTPWGIFKGFRDMAKLGKYLRQQIEDCRRAPRPGMISALVGVEEEGDRLSADELFAMCFLLLAAGHETTVNLLAMSVITLLENPGELEKLKADWSHVDTAADELLRHTSSIQFTKPKYVARDIELFGRQLTRGEVMMPCLAAANYDPAEFLNPESLDLHRELNKHVAFGSGIHVCLGLKLAKAELEIGLQQLFTRYPDLNLAVPRDELPWIPRVGLRSVTEFPLRLSSRG